MLHCKSFAFSCATSHQNRGTIANWKYSSILSGNGGGGRAEGSSLSCITALATYDAADRSRREMARCHFLFTVVLIQVRVLQYAYGKLGLSSGAALLLLLASLVGSYFNIPLAELPEREVRSGQVVEFFGMRYVVPVVADWPRTVIAVNVGGALIPTLLSLYLLLKNRIWGSAAIATIIVTVACYLLAQPVPGIGIAIPALIPPIIAATVALLVTGTNVAAVAYISGSLGTLIGADLLNLSKVQGLGAPVVSIGGAGTFDGVFLTGIIAVLLASFSARA